MDKYVLILGVCKNLDGMPLCGNALLWETPNVKGQECGGMSLCIFAVSIFLSHDFFFYKCIIGIFVLPNFENKLEIVMSDRIE